MQKIILTPEQTARTLALFDEVAIFRILEGEFRAKVLAAGEAFRFEANEELVSQGAPSDAFYLITEGHAMVFHEHDDEHTHLTDMGPASTFGEIGLLLDDVRTAGIRARDGVIAVRFSRDVFHRLFERIPAFGRAVACGMAKRLNKVSSQLHLPDYDGGELDEQLAGHLLPVPFILRHRLLPLGMEGSKLKVGFVDDPDATVVKSIHNYVPGIQLESVRIERAYFNKVMRSRLGLNMESGAQAEESQTTGGCKLDPLLERGLAEGVSDLHLTAGKRPYWRLDGHVKEIEDAPKTGTNELLEVFTPFMDKRHRNEFEETGDTDFGYGLTDHARFRVNMFRDMNGINVSMRLIPSNIMTLDQLGLPPICHAFCSQPHGLVVVTGPTGSGKSTTLAAMINEVNQTRRDHIITLEDPIEFIHHNKQAIIHQREIGGHVSTFARSIRSALREDPDVILVGETRDLETLRLVIEVANTGHLVFATLHTNSALATVNRIVDMFPATSQNQVRNTLSSVMRGIISQTLCRRIGGGRVAAFEVLKMTVAIANLVRDGKTQQIMNALQSGKRDGHQLLNESLGKLVKDEVVTREEALGKTYDPSGLEAIFLRM